MNNRAETTSSIQLIVQYYRCDRPERQAEIDTCLQNNLFNCYIEAVHVLTEEQFDFSGFVNADKIVQTVIASRLTYEKAFKYANHLDERSEHIWIVANADIYFDVTLRELSAFPMGDTVYALSRYECDHDGNAEMLPVEQARGGQDSWIFKTPVKTDQMFTSFFLGIPGCDYRINYEFIRAGYFILNPAFRIKSYHLDLVGFNINQKSDKYIAATTDENIDKGLVAPPPYHHGLYPVDALVVDKKKLFTDYCQLVDKQILSEWKENGTQKQIEEMTKYIDGLQNGIREKEVEISSMSQKIYFLTNEVTSLQNQCQQLIESLSWRITAPLRRLGTLVNFRK